MRVLRSICDTAIDLCLGCRHDRLTRPFTIGAESYMVCLDCGRQLFYSLEDMRRLSRREVRQLRAARESHGVAAAVIAAPGVSPAVARASAAQLPSQAPSPTLPKPLSLVPSQRGSDRAA